MKMLKISLTFVMGLVILLTGCAGARNMVKADGAKYDVSLSRALRDSSGNVIPSERLETVGQYRYTASGWGMVWSFVPLNSIDISQSVNEQVEKSGGNAITNLSIDVQGGILNHVPLLSVLPIWPGFNMVDFTGNIVKIKPEIGDTAGQETNPVSK